MAGGKTPEVEVNDDIAEVTLRALQQPKQSPRHRRRRSKLPSPCGLTARRSVQRNDIKQLARTTGWVWPVAAPPTIS
eukprot:5507522-Lingulodinium_polyedra.AAC.1